MTRRGVIAAALAGLAGIGLGAVGTVVVAGEQRRGATEAVVHDYLLTHPEIIPEAIERLRARDGARVIAAERRAIETPFAGAWAGDPKGDVTLTMFTDYACGFCRASVADIDRLLAEDRRLKLVWREIPVLGAPSDAAARVALAAARQGRYLPFHRALFAAGRPDDAHLAAAATAAGLDPRRLATDRGGADIAREIDGNLALAGRLGVTGTPAFVVGDRLLNGAIGHDALARAIAEARRAQ